MKTVFTLLKAACLLLLLNNRLAAQTTPLAANGRLQIINRQLSNEAGTAIQLRGMSSHGLHWFPQCYTAGSLQALATDWGADVFRAAMYVDEGGYMNDPAGLRAKVTQLVNWAEQYGMYCIIDWHILNPGDPTVHTAEAKDFFATMAQQFAGKKNVLYEICNEPNGVSWSTIKSYAEQVIPVIRQRDANGIILVGTPNYSGTPWDVLGAPLTGNNAYNVMYTYHFYAGSHYLSNVRSNLENVLAQLPLFVSEWGTSNYSGNGGDDYNSAQTWLDFLAGGNSSGIKVSWANWNFADKNETSSALSSGACSSGSWNSTSTSGAWVKAHILNPADNFGPPTPSVVITSPANGATVATGSNVAINASVNNATATKVEFYNGTAKLGEDATAPYSWTITSITAGNYSFTAKAILSSGSLTSAPVSVTASTPANQLPTVSLTSPAANAAFTAPATITLTATASDADGNVAKVEFYNGSNKLGEDTTAPYSYTWTNVAVGSYSLTAKAIDNANAVSTSTAVTAQVYAQGSSGTDLVGPDCVLANDVKVYEVSAANLVNATNFNWWCNGSTQSITPVAGQPGKVTVNFGPSFTGGQVCVGINYSADPWYKQFCKNVTLCTATPPPSNQPPAASITSPATNAAFAAPANITVTANASDADGTVARVEFYNGSNKIGEDATAPYSFTWQNVAAGTYTLTAKAVDNGNATGTSGNVTVVVNGTTPPPTSTGISGPDCVMANDVKTYQLGAADRVNATSYSWWVNGSTQSITPGSNGSVVINFGPYFTGGQVWVGVNYSASPWSKQFSKNVTLCSGARTTATTVLSETANDKGLSEAFVQRLFFPTISSGNFRFVPDKEIRSLTVLDATGRLCFRSERRGAGQSVVFGDGFTAGTYFVQVIYADNTRRTTKVVKTK